MHWPLVSLYISYQLLVFNLLVHLFLLFLILLLAAVFRRKEGRTDKRAVGRTTSFSVVNVTFFPQHIFQRRFVFFLPLYSSLSFYAHTLTHSKTHRFLFYPFFIFKALIFFASFFLYPHTHSFFFIFYNTCAHTHTFSVGAFFYSLGLEISPKIFL